MQFRVREEDQYIEYDTSWSLRVPWTLAASTSSASGPSDARYVVSHSIFSRPELSFDLNGQALPVTSTPGTGPGAGPLRAGLLRRHPHLLQESWRGAFGAGAGDANLKEPQDLVRKGLPVSECHCACLAAPRSFSSAMSPPSGVSPSTPARSPPSRSGPFRRRAPTCAASSARLGLAKSMPTTTVNSSYAFCPRCPAGGCLQPSWQVHVGPSRVAELRRADCRSKQR